jgi:hypothetical protein
VKSEEPGEIAWSTVRNCIEAVAGKTLNGDLAGLSSDALLSAVKSLDIPFSERIARLKKCMTNSEVYSSMWLKLDDGKNVYVRLHKHFHGSFIAREPLESRDISVYTEEQEKSIFEDGGFDGVAMHKPYWPLLSLKFDAETCEIVWLQGAPGFNGKKLKVITEIFTNLFSPSGKIFLADQAVKNGRPLRQYYPLVKPAEDISCAPGYYGSWGFVPANLWKIELKDGGVATQSRDLYYSAVEYLRGLSVEHLKTVLQVRESKDHFSRLAGRYHLKTDATFHQLIKIVYEKMALEKDKQAEKDFNWIFHFLLKSYSRRLKKSKNARLFELALQILIRTEVWERKPADERGRFYPDYLLKRDADFLSSAGNGRTYSKLVKTALNINDHNRTEWRE